MREAPTTLSSKEVLDTLDNYVKEIGERADDLSVLSDKGISEDYKKGLLAIRKRVEEYQVYSREIARVKLGIE